MSKMRKVIMSSVLALVLVAAPSFAGNHGHHGHNNQSGQCSQAGQSSQSEQSSQAGQSSQSEQSSQAGQSSQSDQAGQCDQASQCGGHHEGFFSKVKNSFKKGFEAGKKIGTKAHDAVQNKVMDAGTAVKKAVTGEKEKTFVKGHYDKNGKHIKGHWRTVESKGCKR